MATPLVSTPLVSVVTATYNRPAVLAYAIRSVIAQSLSDWEMLVVGDACTDDTAALVASFADPRLRFHNLAANFGEQSGPNNEGVRMAGGRYLAFLNHDDLWFPDHLALAVAELEATQADGIFAPGAAVRQADRKRLEAGDWQFGWSGRHRNGCYDPATTMGPASTLVLGMDAARRIGPWRPAAECFAESSQDFLFRAWRMGLTIRRGPELSVLMFNSGERKGSYRVDAADEQDFFWGRMTFDAEGLRRDFEARAADRAPLVQPVARRRSQAVSARFGTSRPVAEGTPVPLQARARSRRIHPRPAPPPRPGCCRSAGVVGHLAPTRTRWLGKP